MWAVEMCKRSVQLYALIIQTRTLIFFYSGTEDLNKVLVEIEVISSKICKVIDLGDEW